MNVLPEHLTADVGRGFVEITSEENDDLERTGRKLKLGSLLAVVLWLILSLLAFTLAPSDSYEIPAGIDRDCHLLTALLVFVVTCARLLQMLMKGQSTAFLKSGLVIGTIMLQMLAMISNLILALVPCPVIFDHLTGQKTHVFRFIEWIALTFFMVFLTDNIETSAVLRFRTSICVALAASAGVILPMCQTVSMWFFVLGCAGILFSNIFVLLHQRSIRFRQVRSLLKKGALYRTAADQESYDITRSSYLLTMICCVAWTILVSSYLVVCALPLFLPPDMIPDSALALHGCANEVLSKVWYLNTLLNAYDNIFDVNTRVSRRLEELRRFMYAVWQSSSDSLVFCVTKADGHISARVSPSFLTTAGIDLKEFGGAGMSILLDIDPQQGSFSIYSLNLSQSYSREAASSFTQALKASKATQLKYGETKGDPEDLRNMKVLARHVATTVRAKEVEDAEQEVCFEYSGGTVRCESKISSLKDGCLVIILRDISDRVERFEIEKKLVEEQAIRTKDAETNHFTRHEVKNGILASIGLLDHMRDCMKTRLLAVSSQISDASIHSINSDQGMMVRSSSALSLVDCQDMANGVEDTLVELDSTLHDVLDTILDEVMAREIIYGEYTPRRERIELNEVLATVLRGSPSRCPLDFSPAQFPVLILDRQLVRHIYRNAVSNACRYGKYDGIVETIVHYDEHNKVLSLKVINEPGEGHEQLVALLASEVAGVFEKGHQLSAAKQTNNVSSHSISSQSEFRKESSGNGAWIMRRCAEALQGWCNIAFEPDRTTFEFECPVEIVRAGSDAATEGAQEFGLPENTWCIVVEDSAVQRKLLARMLKNSGIPDSCSVLLGKDSTEILGFPDTAKALIEAHPDDFFLFIVDENLDMVPNGGVDVVTVSGSSLIAALRNSLSSDLEQRVLSLVRSANDSASDIELYLSRAHGYLLKQPIKKGHLLQAIKPWWLQYFPGEVQVFTNRDGKLEDEVYGPLPDDIRFVLDQIHSLCNIHDIGVLSRRWSAIREKLQSLKGDLKTMGATAPVLDAINEIAALQHHKHLPKNFMDNWYSLRKSIEDLL
jgi:hypothetical protein